MDESQVTHLVGGGILVILVLDRVTHLVKVALAKRNGEGGAACQTHLSVDALAKATAAGFLEAREDNKAIREHLHNIANTLAGLITRIAIIQDRSHRREGE